MGIWHIGFDEEFEQSRPHLNIFSAKPCSSDLSSLVSGVKWGSQLMTLGEEEAELVAERC